MSSLSSDSEAWSDDFALLVILIAKALFLSPDTYFPVFVCLSVCVCLCFICLPRCRVLTGVLWLTHKWHKAVHTCTERSCAGCAWASGDSADIDLLFRECREPGLNRPPSHRQTHTPCYLWGPVASDEFRLLDIKLLRLVCPKNQFIDSTSVKNDSFCFMIKLFFSQWCIFTLKLYIRIIFSGYTDCLCVSAPVCPFAKDCVAWFSVYLCSVFRPG